MYVVVVTEKGGSQQRIDLDADRISIGRVHGNDVVLPRGNVSKRHATIERAGGAFQLSDLGSTNGTFVNGRRAREKQTVNPGDKIYVGDFILHIEAQEASEPGISVPTPTSSQNLSASSVNVVSEKAEKGPPSIRSSAPPSAGQKREPTEKRVRVPKLTTLAEERPMTPPPPPAQPLPSGMASPKAAQSGPATAAPQPIAPKRPLTTTESGVTTVTQLLADAAIQLGVSEINDGPVALVPEKVAKLRRVLAALVSFAAKTSALPESHTPSSLMATAFRAAVDLGPLNAWLEDESISEIRIVGTTSLMLRRSGTLIVEDNPFASDNALANIIARLSAGLERTGSRFFLEDGAAVFRPDTPVPTLIIDKKWGVPRAFGQQRLLGKDETTVLTDAIAADAKIAIAGQKPVARRAVLAEIARAVPKRSLVAVVGELPTLIDYPFISVPFRRSADGVFANALDDACALGPDWLIVADGSWQQIPHLLAVTANRLAVLAELPVGASGALHRELAVTLLSGGLAPTPAQAALSIHAAFDIIVVTDLSDKGVPCIRTILASALSDKGSWSPKVLYAKS